MEWEVGLGKDATCVVLWLPQTQRLLTQVYGRCALSASWHLALFSSSLVRAWKFLRCSRGAFSMQMRVLVLQGFPTTSTLQS